MKLFGANLPHFYFGSIRGLFLPYKFKNSF